MLEGTDRGQQCCVRIKMDMKHNNGALRDPTIYRCKRESHVRHGDKYKWGNSKEDNILKNSINNSYEKKK